MLTDIFAGGKHRANCTNPVYDVGSALDRQSRRIFPYVCMTCDVVQNHYAPRDAALALERAGQVLRRVMTETERRVWINPELPLDCRPYEVCERCGDAAELETHHWAPRGLFTDAEKWPTSRLCHYCHTTWHGTTMLARGQPWFKR